MLRAERFRVQANSLLTLALVLGGCEKIQPKQPVDTARTRAEAKRHKDACASSTAYDRMKRVIFSQARRQVSSHPTNLETLEAFSFVRMEDPVVESWDPALDLTRCRGRFILDVPPGSEPAFGGERRLQADISYTAQGAADASGLVYAIKGAEPIIDKLATFNVADAKYRPLPAVDAGVALADTVKPRGQVEAQEVYPDSLAPARIAQEARRDPPFTAAPQRSPEQEVARPASPTPMAPVSHDAAATVRSFYNALGQGNGEVASAQVIPGKRNSRAYSPDAISRFYGRLPEPLRLTGVHPISRNSYRVTYRYAAAGSRCNGSAVVTLTSDAGRPLIRSIVASRGC